LFRLAAAEVRYGAGSLLAWLAVMLVMACVPVLETPSVTAVTAVMAFLFLVMPAAAVVNAFRSLGSERSEGRARLYGTLPLGTVQVALARQIRGSALPLAGLLVAALLSLVGVTFMGREFLSSLAGGWVLGTLFFLSVAAVALVTLLYDSYGMTFAQIVVALLVGAAFAANAYAGEFAARILGPVTAAAQTPTGLLASVGVCLLLWGADVLVLRWRDLA